MFYHRYFDVIVVGGGHAGTEAALASARIGCDTLLLTHNIDTIGHMPCNPSIGGIGKGHLVKEIDAMGGVMAQAIDHSGVQFRILNSSKGPAVRATRAQADKSLYRTFVRNILENQSNLLLIQQSIDDIIIERDNVVGVINYRMGIKFRAKSVVLTVGTFLNGKIHIGTNSYSGGRAGDPSSVLLSNNLQKKQIFKINSLKTGTSPRIDSRSIDFSCLISQHSHEPLPVFSFMGSAVQHPKQIPCYITHTNDNTHDLVFKNITKSPLYSGIIKGVGPRYCPSIEDKVVRFHDRDSHQIFLEPEGLLSNEIYLNGISTSLPLDVQVKIVRSIKGLEKAHIVRPGYAIEYDFFDPRDLKLTLESKLIRGLFFAGQVNGTTGYEEAAAQGLLAGINAAKLACDQEGWSPKRHQAYIGVLVDDLCNRGTTEPYRMFTSRAEYRLILREDNADLRLTEIGRHLGLINDTRWKIFCSKRESIEIEHQRLKNTWIYPNSQDLSQLNVFLKKPITCAINGEELLRRPEINYLQLMKLPSFISSKIDYLVGEQIDIKIKYQGYINRQEKEILHRMRNENAFLPIDIDYSAISNLSAEVIDKLSNYRPNSIGQASRIPGVTPVAISILLIWLKKQGFLQHRRLNMNR